MTGVTLLGTMIAIWLSHLTPTAAIADCKSGFGERLDDVLSQAEYVALYSADDFYGPDVQSANGRVFLSLFRTIHGEAPLQVQTRGVKAEVIPQGYFDLTYRHQQIVDTGYVNSGLSVIVASKGCSAIPAEGFVPGYTYLVLGGVESRISFEPILNHEDPLLQYLTRQLESQ